MYYQTLIRKSKLELSRTGEPIEVRFTAALFADGAEWMRNRLNTLDPRMYILPEKRLYNCCGIIKYGCCIALTAIVAILLAQVSLWLLPACIIVFYLAEVQFLFLFPLLLDAATRPFLTSLKATRKIGTLRAVANILPIGVYMVFGLLNLKAPLKNWHVGCLCVLIWYNDEVRGRL